MSFTHDELDEVLRNLEDENMSKELVLNIRSMVEECDGVIALLIEIAEKSLDHSPIETMGAAFVSGVAVGVFLERNQNKLTAN